MKIKVEIRRSDLFHYSMIAKYYYNKIRVCSNHEIQDYADYYNLKHLILKLLNKIHVTTGQPKTKEVSITIDINEAETLIRLSWKADCGKIFPFDISYQILLLNLREELSKKINEQHWTEHYRQLESKPTDTPGTVGQISST